MGKNQFDGQETETGYVSDSSMNSRAGMNKTNDNDKQNIKRKTKSERDKKRSSRASVIEEGSSSEACSSIEKTQNRYRKRAGSKRVDNDSNNQIDDKNSRYRKRAGSKTCTTTQRIQSFNEQALEGTVQENICVSTCTLKMDTKDIYYGTWNPKERAVLDQVLTNIDSSDERQPPVEEDVGKQQIKPKGNEKKKSFFGRLKKVLKIHDKDISGDMFPAIDEDPFQDYVLPQQKKKKNIFKRLVSKEKKKQLDMPRRRAHSTNDSSNYAIRNDAINARINLNKKRSGSTHSLKSLFNRARSVDNLNGAFDYFANQNQIFQRTPSMTKIQCKSRTNSVENLKASDVKKNASQKSLNHGFEPVTPTVKDLGFEEKKFIFAQSKVIQPRTASQRSVYQAISRQSSIEQEFPPRYCDNFLGENSRYFNGYYSDVAPASASPTLNKSKNDSYMSYSAMATCPSSCPPVRKAFRPPPYDHPNHKKLIIRQQVDDTLTDEYSQKYPSNSGSVTPVCVSGYNSDNELGNIPCEQLSMVPYHARRAIQRSLSKHSSASTYSSNYGYLSESSFCEDDEVFAASSPKNLSLKKENYFERNDMVRTSIKSGVLSTVL